MFRLARTLCAAAHVACLCVGVVALGSCHVAGSAAAQGGEGVREERIAPASVNMRNVDAFAEQLRRDLPVGTPRRAAEDYLAGLGLSHEYAEPDGTRLGNAIGASMDLANQSLEPFFPGLTFPARLRVTVRLDAEARVQAVEASVDVLAP